jgi:hypothetical protein
MTFRSLLPFAILDLVDPQIRKGDRVTRRVATTTFRSRGRLTGLVRDEYPAGTGQNRTTQTDNRESALNGADEALFYRARLILGDSLPRPQR